MAYGTFQIPGPQLAKYATPQNNTILRHITPGQAAQAQAAKEAASGVSALAGKTSVLTEASEKVDTLIHQRPRLRHTTHQTYNHQKHSEKVQLGQFTSIYYCRFQNFWYWISGSTCTTFLHLFGGCYKSDLSCCGRREAMDLTPTSESTCQKRIKQCSNLCGFENWGFKLILQGKRWLTINFEAICIYLP